MRVKFKPWAEDYIKEKNEIFISDEIFSQKNYFPNANPVHIEIGMGKGRFIIEKAKQNPHINYIGIEMQPSAIVMAGKKLEQEPLANLKLYNKDVAKLTDYEQFKNNIDVIYLNFSDPWPKTRHHKRRLTAPSFLNIYKELLSKDGIIEQKTDNDKLFEFSLESYSQNGFILKQVILDLHNEKEENIVTEYEEKFSNKGFTIKKAIVEKKKEN